ncbi:hypothetical protein HK099_008487 [Clydaea vesicula]|uniref:LysM domain-containing protein n=1 Tax=Clydaea vesicula TaxID=447962 RepID=A0AAD5XT48_9FUNG|nr:hypothetical protein HK099_008487 [Clydaea vesicula]
MDRQKINDSDCCCLQGTKPTSGLNCEKPFQLKSVEKEKQEKTKKNPKTTSIKSTMTTSIKSTKTTSVKSTKTSSSLSSAISTPSSSDGFKTAYATFHSYQLNQGVTSLACSDKFTPKGIWSLSNLKVTAFNVGTNPETGRVNCGKCLEVKSATTSNREYITIIDGDGKIPGYDFHLDLSPDSFNYLLGEKGVQNGHGLVDFRFVDESYCTPFKSSTTVSSTTSASGSTATQTPPISDASCMKSYIVKSGDIGVSIAAANQITFDELSRINPNLVWTNLKIGQILCVKKTLNTSNTIENTNSDGKKVLHSNFDVNKNITGFGTYYYDYLNNVCPNEAYDTYPENKGITTCETYDSTSPMYKTTLGSRKSNYIVAISDIILNKDRAKYCGKKVNIKYNGRLVETEKPFFVWDGCGACTNVKQPRIDLSLSALQNIAGEKACADGVVEGFTWEVVDEVVFPFIP